MSLRLTVSVLYKISKIAKIMHAILLIFIIKIIPKFVEKLNHDFNVISLESGMVHYKKFLSHNDVIIKRGQNETGFYKNI